MRTSGTRWVWIWVCLFVGAVQGTAHAVVQWSRQYRIPCSGCHAPYPRLNATGIAFRENGYRFAPGERAKVSLQSLRDFIGPTWGPSLTVKGGGDSSVDARGVRIHLGGPLGTNAGFLVQPTIGGTGDFNMAQGMLAFGSKNQRTRLVFGRLYAWGNGGGRGAADRYATATFPRMFSSLQGVALGGLGTGARLEYTPNGRTYWTLFASDMDATTNRSGLIGGSLAFRLDSQSSSTVEFFYARASIPFAGSSDSNAERFGIVWNRAFLTKKGNEGLNILGGVLFGNQSRSVSSGAGTSLWAGFVEADWSPHEKLTLLIRQEWESRLTSGGTAAALTLGAAFQLAPNLRFDTDLQVNRPGFAEPQLTTRLRIVY